MTMPDCMKVTMEELFDKMFEETAFEVGDDLKNIKLNEILQKQYVS